MNLDENKLEDEITEILHSLNTSPTYVANKSLSSSPQNYENFFIKDAKFDDIKNEIQSNIDEMFAMDVQMNNYMELLLAGSDSFHDDLISKFNIISSDLLLEMQNNTKIYQAYYRLALRYRELKEQQATCVGKLNQKNTQLQQIIDDINIHYKELKAEYDKLNSAHLVELAGSMKHSESNLTEELESVRRHNQELSQRINSLEDENSRLFAKKEDAEEVLNERKSKIDLMEEEFETLKSKYRILEESLSMQQNECLEVEKKYNEIKVTNAQLFEENKALKTSNEKSSLELQKEKDQKLVLVENEVRSQNENIMLKKKVQSLNAEVESIMAKHHTSQNQLTESLNMYISENDKLTSQKNKLTNQLLNNSKTIENIKINDALQAEEFETISANLKQEILETKNANKQLHLRLLKANKANSMFSAELTRIEMELQKQKDINYYNAVSIRDIKQNNVFGISNSNMGSNDSHNSAGIPAYRASPLCTAAISNPVTSRINSQENDSVSIDNKVRNFEGNRGSTSMKTRTQETLPLETINAKRSTVKRSSTFNSLPLYHNNLPVRPTSHISMKPNSFSFGSSTPKKLMKNQIILDDNSYMLRKTESNSTRTKSADLSTRWKNNSFSNLPSSAPNDTLETKLTSERSDLNFSNANSSVNLGEFDITDYDPYVDDDDDDIHHMETIYDSPRWISKPKIKLKQDFGQNDDNASGSSDI